MKQKLVIISTVFLLLLTACKGENDDSINKQEQTAEPVTETDLSIEEITAEDTTEEATEEITEETTEEITEETTEQAYQPATREYFENVDKDYTKDDIFNEIGKNDGYYGSGEIYYVWVLDDGTYAYVVFYSTNNKIARIHIIYPDHSGELIYIRERQTQDEQ